MFNSLYWEYYLMGIILLPAIILAIYAQTKVTTTYSEFSSVMSKKGIKACEMARTLLDCADLQNVQITKVAGELTDYYDDKRKVVALSAKIYDSSSVSALGVAAHEVGHALQFKNTTYLLKFVQ